MDGVFRVLSGIGIALLFFALIIGALVGIAWLGELRRRRLEDRLGFKEFVQAGARMKHPTMIEGFARQVPESLADMKIQFSVLNLGDFRVGSGQVYVVDPAFYSEEDLEPFDEDLPAGDYPVQALILDNDGDQRVAAVRVKFEDRESDHIEPAWTRSARENALKTRFLPTFGVDSAMGALFSRESIAAMKAEAREQSSYAPGNEAENPYLSGNPSHLCQKTEFEDGSNCFLFYSGIGDGAYPCYFEKCQEGSIVGLIIDFLLLDEPLRVGFQTPGIDVVE